ncbi:hypothetical protein fugu_016988 [Takifugu bimaculatus]|uniref:Tubulin epsilon and delta complex protein 1 domain-containing protein n=1 Tax=Takifugu bimaculatus TaxID=433685 RepID=A0A4Z2BUJ3_9TELE|nr:hypothetical protein fugu_016988 [Takifugu bimaculatus]
MKRGKSAASVEMKQVIAALCRLLTAAGLEVVPPPETFRRAKFGGGPDVEGQLLQLLMEILQTFGTVSCKDGMEGELRKQVIAGLWQTGYYGDWMYKGSGDKGHGGERSTSRDLLLALGWLIATGSLEKLLTKRVQQLDKMLLTPTHDSVFDSSLTDPLVEKLPCVPDGRRECYHGKRGLETLEEMLLTLPRVQVCSTPTRSLRLLF